VMSFFQARISWPGWLWTTVFLVSASWVARITSVSNPYLARFLFFIFGVWSGWCVVVVGGE
jgi:hypothetical protein